MDAGYGNGRGRAAVNQLPAWDEVFTIVSRQKIGGGPRMNPGDKFTWEGTVNGRSVEIVSTARTLNSEVSFHTSSNARIHYSPEYYHGVELSSKENLTTDERAAILAMAQAADERPVYWRS